MDSVKKNSVLCVRLDDDTKRFLVDRASYNGVSVGYFIRRIITAYIFSVASGSSKK